MEDRTKEKNKFFVENENTQRRRKKKRAWHRAKKVFWCEEQKS